MSASSGVLRGMGMDCDVMRLMAHAKKRTRPEGAQEGTQSAVKPDEDWEDEARKAIL